MRKSKSSQQNSTLEELSIEDAVAKIHDLESANKTLKEKNILLEVQKKSFAEIAFQYGKELNKTIGEVKFLEMMKELSVVQGKHNPIHETNLEAVEDKEKLEEFITNYLSNKKYDFQNEFLPLFLSGKITMIGNKDYLYWFEALDDWIYYAEQGNKDAQKNLILCFENGYGVKKNKELKEYWEARLKGEIIEPPCYEEYFEYKKPERLEEVKEKKDDSFNIDSANLAVDFLQTDEFVAVKKEADYLYEQSSKIQSIHIKTPVSIEKLLILAKKYDFLPYDIKNEIFGSTLIMHTSQFDFFVDNLKEMGGFLKKERRADCSMKISNNSEWSCSFAISVKDNLGNTFNAKCKVNPGSSSQINLFSGHLVGTKIESVVFKTLDASSRTFAYNPKNWVIVK